MAITKMNGDALTNGPQQGFSERFHSVRMLWLLILLHLIPVVVRGFGVIHAPFLRSRGFEANEAALYQHTVSRSKSTTSLAAARRNLNNKGSNKKKNKKNSKKNNEKKQSNNRASSPPPAPVGIAASMASNKHTPPWKVLSTKDAKKNMENEKQRRRQIEKHGDTNIVIESSNNNEALLDKSFLAPQEQLLLKWKRIKQSKDYRLDFIGSYLEKRLPPKLGVPEIAFLGRSNVGKSSLLNKLCGTDAARVGKTPGATASVNLYQLSKNNNKALLGLVDLPGFGYAKLSKETQESVQVAAERYLAKRTELALGILLVDIRRAAPSSNDKVVLAALYDMGLPIVVVATKVDKLSESEKETNLKSIQQGLGLPEGQPLCVSAVTGEGTKLLWSIVMEACDTRVEEFRQETIESSNKEKKQPKKVELEDDDELAYDQGYDWIHGESPAVGLEYSDQELGWDDEYEGDFHEDYEDELSNSEQEQPSMKLKDLKKRARRMERGGEV